MINARKAAWYICYHGQILLRGIAKVLYGAAIAGVAALAVYGFDGVTSEGGYVAVCDFIGAVCLTILALCGVYYFGSRPRKHFSSKR